MRTHPSSLPRPSASPLLRPRLALRLRLAKIAAISGIWWPKIVGRQPYPGYCSDLEVANRWLLPVECRVGVEDRAAQVLEAGGRLHAKLVHEGLAQVLENLEGTPLPARPAQRDHV